MRKTLKEVMQGESLLEFIKTRNISSLKAKEVLSNYHKKQIQKRNFENFSFLLYVDYFDEIIKLVNMGNYSLINDEIREISSKKFRGNYNGLKKMRLFCFSEGTRNDKILKRIEERGYRPANEVELLTFCYKYPNIQQKNAVVALDALDCKKKRKIKVYHSLYVYQGEVDIDISLYGWDEYVVFLGVEKEE